MREKLNENPLAQIVVIGVLVLVAGVFLLKSLGGGGEESSAAEGTAAPAETAESSGPETPATASPEEAAGSLEGSAPVAATAAAAAPSSRPLPDDVEAAYQRGDTVALLIYRPGGIDDRLLAQASGVLDAMSGVALFTAPAGRIARYAPITGPLGVNQVPALVVVRPRRLNGSGPATATVDYGFQSAEEVRQAVIDAGYKGPHLTYAPN